MQRIHRTITLFIVFLLLFTIISGITAFAATTTTVNFRLVLRSPMKYAACTAYLEEYESIDSKTAINSQQIAISRIDNWEKEVQLEPGFYQVVYVGVVGGWEIEILGTSDPFEVKGEKMTVYIGVDNDEKPVDMPDEWLIYGEDDQNFYIWDKTDDNATPTEPPSTTEPTPPSVEDLPNVDTDIEADPDAPNHGLSPSIPNPSTTPNKQEEEPTSVRIGNTIFYILVAVILIVCIFLLRKIQKERGA